MDELSTLADGQDATVSEVTDASVRYAIIEGAVVVNLVVAGVDFAADFDGGGTQVAEPIPDESPVSVGWHEVSPGQFEPPPPPPPEVPASVTMAKARKALFLAGKLQAVQLALNNLAEPARTLALIDWEFEPEVHRQHALVLQLAPVIGGDAAVDALFIAADALP